MEKFKSKGLTPEKYQGRKLQFSSTPPLGYLVTEAQQYDTPQRATEIHEELTKGMEKATAMQNHSSIVEGENC